MGVSASGYLVRPQSQVMQPGGSASRLSYMAVGRGFCTMPYGSSHRAAHKEVAGFPQGE